jgi:uncharacterized membrane protein YgdD (TMEM256/DUF423 family)
MNETLERLWIVLGALVGLTGVAMAALAAHAFTGLDPAAMRMVNSAVLIQGWHAPALVLVGVWAGRGGGLAHLAGAAFAVGTLLFSGSTYVLALGGFSLGLVAPAGGMLLMLGWALLGLSALGAR